MIKVVAFDMWQTLGTYRFNLYKEVLKVIGLDMSLEEFTLRKSKINVKEDLDDKEKYVKKIKLLGVTDESILQRVRELYVEAHDSIFLYDETLETLNELKKKRKIIALITNVDSYAHNKIMVLFPKDFFDYIIASHEIGIRKPDKRIFLKLIEKFDVKPEEILMVGDSIEMDIKPAKLLGWKTALINRDKKKSSYPDYNLINLKELLNIV